MLSMCWSITKDVEIGAAKKSWEPPMYDPGGCMIMRYFKRLNKHYYFLLRIYIIPISLAVEVDEGF